MDKTTFEIGLDICLCYITYCKIIKIEFQYLKPIFKSRKNSMNIWGTIVLGLKSLVYFLEKKSRINSNIYIN